MGRGTLFPQTDVMWSHNQTPNSRAAAKGLKRPGRKMPKSHSLSELPFQGGNRKPGTPIKVPNQSYCSYCETMKRKFFSKYGCCDGCSKEFKHHYRLWDTLKEIETQYVRWKTANGSDERDAAEFKEFAKQQVPQVLDVRNQDKDVLLRRFRALMEDSVLAWTDVAARQRMENIAKRTAETKANIVKFCRNLIEKARIALGIPVHAPLADHKAELMAKLEKLLKDNKRCPWDSPSVKRQMELALLAGSSDESDMMEHTPDNLSVSAPIPARLHTVAQSMSYATSESSGTFNIDSPSAVSDLDVFACADGNTGVEIDFSSGQYYDPDLMFGFGQDDLGELASMTGATDVMGMNTAQEVPMSWITPQENSFVKPEPQEHCFVQPKLERQDIQDIPSYLESITSTLDQFADAHLPNFHVEEVVHYVQRGCIQPTISLVLRHRDGTVATAEETDQFTAKLMELAPAELRDMFRSSDLKFVPKEQVPVDTSFIQRPSWLAASLTKAYYKDGSIVVPVTTVIDKIDGNSPTFETVQGVRDALCASLVTCLKPWSRSTHLDVSCAWDWIHPVRSGDTVAEMAVHVDIRIKGNESEILPTNAKPLLLSLNEFLKLGEVSLARDGVSLRLVDFPSTETPIFAPTEKSPAEVDPFGFDEDAFFQHFDEDDSFSESDEDDDDDFLNDMMKDWEDILQKPVEESPKALKPKVESADAKEAVQYRRRFSEPSLSTKRRFWRDSITESEFLLDKVVVDFRSALGKEKFLNCSKFLITMIHNYFKHIDDAHFESARTVATDITQGLNTPEGCRLLSQLGITLKNDWYSFQPKPNLEVLEKLCDLMHCARKELYVLEAWELFSDDINLAEVLHEGQFSTIRKGTWKKDTEVAVKIMKQTSDEARTRILMEANIMKKFDHQNVLTLIGIISGAPNIYMVMEHMVMDLSTHLKTVDFTDGQKLNLAVQVAAGLEHIHFENILHCNLHSSNVLVSPNGQLKITDFGMSMIARQPTSINPELCKVRWTAPEVWLRQQYSSGADIWSWGIVFYEICTKAATLYGECSDSEIRERLNKGYRLPAPSPCPKEFYQLMQRCWSMDPVGRPSAQELMQNLMSVKVTYIDKTERFQEQQEIRKHAWQSSSWTHNKAEPNEFRGSRLFSSPPSLYVDGNKRNKIPAFRYKNRVHDVSVSDVSKIAKGTNAQSCEPCYANQGQDASAKTPKSSPQKGKSEASKKQGDFDITTSKDGTYILSVIEKIPRRRTISPNKDGKYQIEKTPAFSTIKELVSHIYKNNIPVLFGSKEISLSRPVNTEAKAMLDLESNGTAQQA